MDKVTVTTAVIGLLAVARNMIDTYWDMDGISRESTTPLNLALREVKQCRSTIRLLYNTLALVETGELPFPQRLAWINVDNIIAVLTDTVLAFSELETICAAIADLMAQAGSTIDVSDGQFNSKITALCARIRWQNSSMTTMTTVLKCHGEADAQHSRTALDQRITRLLTSNSELSIRMRTVEDIFGAKVSPPLAARVNMASPSPFMQTNLGASRSRVWSTFTGYTLADFPMLSIIALPVSLPEIKGGSEFYTFDYARDVSQDSDETPPAPETVPPHLPTPPPIEENSKKKKRLNPMSKFKRLRRIV